MWRTFTGLRVRMGPQPRSDRVVESAKSVLCFRGNDVARLLLGIVVIWGFSRLGGQHPLVFPLREGEGGGQFDVGEVGFDFSVHILVGASDRPILGSMGFRLLLLQPGRLSDRRLIGGR